MKPITLYDVGARGGVGMEWNNLCSRLNVILFEPDQEECKRISTVSHNFKSLRAIPVALSDTSRATNFYMTQNLQCSSLLQPNSALLRSRYPVFSKHFEVVDEITINTVRLDQVIEQLELPQPDVLKLDVQGAEGLILAGLGKHLSTIKAIRLETHLREIYLNEQMFWELHSILNDAGFELRRILTDKSRRFRGGEIVEMDVFYANSFYQTGKATQSEHEILVSAMEAWGMHTSPGQKI